MFFGLTLCIVFFLSVYFISNVYSKYSATPMIISLNSESTDIRKLPFPGKINVLIRHCKTQVYFFCFFSFFFSFILFFYFYFHCPAVTVCNMNQAVKSVVEKFPANSEEYPMVQSICTHAVDENVTNIIKGKWATFQQLLIKVRICIVFCSDSF